MSVKSIFLSLSFVMISAFATASGEVMTTEVMATEITPVTVMVGKPCTVDATFTSGDTSVNVSVTAADCATAYATLGAIATAMDQE